MSFNNCDTQSKKKKGMNKCDEKHSLINIKKAK
jgi:hypothetical protein